MPGLVGDSSSTTRKDTYGVESDGKGLTMNFVTQGPYSHNMGGRTHMVDGDSKYKMFKLKNKEFTFDVDVSNMPCGLNGALYFVEMPEDGGMSSGANGNATAGGNNAAGAKHGTGCCDAQCPHDLKLLRLIRACTIQVSAYLIGILSARDAKSEEAERALLHNEHLFACMPDHASLAEPRMTASA